MISSGMKVTILLGGSYGNRFAGVHGVVRKWHREANKYGVKLDGFRNPDSKEGLFWFPENQLVAFPFNPVDMRVKKVIFNGPKTIVIWADGSKTIASCGEGDEFDPYAGFCAAVTKKVFGSTNAAKKAIAPYLPEPAVKAPSSMEALAEALKNIGKL